MKPVYFDMSVRDLERARAFFAAVLGWRFERFPMPYEYYRIRAGAAAEEGIDGGIGCVADAPAVGAGPATIVTVAVPDLDATLARVAGAGGHVVESKVRIPGIGWYSTVAEPGGLPFGLVEVETAKETA